MTFQQACNYAGLEIRMWRLNPFIPIGLGILAGVRILFVLWGYGALQQAPSCAQQDKNQTTFEAWVYQHAMSRTFPIGSARRVALVTMTEGVEPLDVINNTCANRSFLAELVPELVSLKAAVVAIDQSYSESSCNDKAANDPFRRSLQAVAVPVIVGQRVHNRLNPIQGGDCLVEEPKFKFSLMPPGAGNLHPDQMALEKVKSGLLRLNGDLRKIPLFWWAFPTDGEAEDKPLAPAQEHGFAYEVALATPGNRVRDDQNLQLFFNRNEHPFASLVSKFPTWTAMDVLCYGPNKIAVEHPEWGDCDKIPHVPFKLTGKVVVVGDHIESDRKSLGDESRFGMDLHASYVEAILDQQYMGTASRWLDLVLTGLFILSIVACEAMTVRELNGAVVLNPVQHAVSLSVLMAIWIIFVVLVWIYGHLVMPNFLLAVTSMTFSLLGVLLFALFFKWEKRHPLPSKEIK